MKTGTSITFSTTPTCNPLKRVRRRMATVGPITRQQPPHIRPASSDQEEYMESCQICGRFCVAAGSMVILTFTTGAINFVIMDWDFDATHWQHWNSLAKDDERFWTALMTQILEQPPSYWWGATSAQASQKGTTYSQHVTQESLLPE